MPQGIDSTVELTLSYSVSYHRNNWFATAFGQVLYGSISLPNAEFRPSGFCRAEKL